ncbi:putative calcium-binding mitochondrial carrier K02F3.2 [Ditylenchus destructor]|uniref:Calcium-binding mitochondrial carrier K02F3.2 n=1 Tax=Ditylenchus destructor TaxID=166010 RepID=A0AAD4NEN7_9BILA|nr:putative calcium-binding mitochondrial carrier K02F3.2 [Ditylenchus destructor]
MGVIYRDESFLAEIDDLDLNPDAKQTDPALIIRTKKLTCVIINRFILFESSADHAGSHLYLTLSDSLSHKECHGVGCETSEFGLWGSIDYQKLKSLHTWSATADQYNREKLKTAGLPSIERYIKEVCGSPRLFADLKGEEFSLNYALKQLVPPSSATINGAILYQRVGRRGARGGEGEVVAAGGEAGRCHNLGAAQFVRRTPLNPEKLIVNLPPNEKDTPEYAVLKVRNRRRRRMAGNQSGTNQAHNSTWRWQQPHLGFGNSLSSLRSCLTTGPGIGSIFKTALCDVDRSSALSGSIPRANHDSLSKVFNKYASVEKSGKKYMTDCDFIREYLGLYKTEDYNAETVRLLASAADTSKDGLISFEEFCAFEATLCAPDALYLTAFDIFDNNASESITAEEFEKVIRHTTPLMELDFDFDSEFIKRYFGAKKTRQIGYLAFCQLLHDFYEEQGVQGFKKMSNGLIQNAGLADSSSDTQPGCKRARYQSSCLAEALYIFVECIFVER